MKHSITLLCLALASCQPAFAHDHVPADTVDIYSQYGHTYFLDGNLIQLDKEDQIKQIEIVNAHTGWTGFDSLFANGFELYNVNWIVIGDDSSNNEFGFALDCVDESDYKDMYGDTHVTLWNCHMLFNEANRSP